MTKHKSSARIDKKTNKLKKKNQKYLEKYGVEYEKVKSEKHSKIKYIKQFLPYFKKEKWALVGVAIIGILFIVCSTFAPLSASRLVDTLISGLYNDAFYELLFYAFMCILSCLICFALDQLQTKAVCNIAYRIRNDIAKQLANVQVNKFNTTGSGDIIARINNDPNGLVDNFNSVVRYFLNFLRQTSRVALAFTFSYIIGGFILLCGVFIYLFASYIVKKHSTPANRLLSKIDDKNISQSNEFVKGIRDIKNLNIASYFLQKFKAISLNKRNAEQKSKTIDNFDEEFTYGLAPYIAEVLLYALSIYLIINGQLTVGEFSVLLIYDFDMFYTFVSISRIKKSIYAMEVNAKRVAELFDPVIYPKESFGDQTLPNAQGELEFRDVCFDYDKEIVLENINFKIKPNECIGIVGRSGEGKSTILNLIPRIIDPKSGVITIDGTDTKQLDCATLREIVSVVPQSPYIFNLSIKENLKLVKPDATDKKLREVCKKANIIDFIQNSEKGFDTVVGEGGVVLSGGQKQRLAIARAFLKQSKILLLDEATSALDNESQNEIKKAINEINKSCTVIIVAHRLSTVSDCDKILVLSNHKIVASGKHAELMKTCEIYQNLYKQEN